MPIKSLEIQSTRDFHLNEKTQTMEGEFSMSYLLRGLEGGMTDLMRSGRCYGEELGEKLSGLIQHLSGNPIILNIGDGLGLNSQGMRKIWDSKGMHVQLIGMDLAPDLLIAQRGQNPDTPFVQADAVSIPVADGSIDGVINNEMIADLPVMIVEKDRLAVYVNIIKRRYELLFKNANSFSEDIDALKSILAEEFHLPEESIEAWSQVISCFLKYDLNPPSGNLFSNESEYVAINTGAIQFLEGIHRVLKTGGIAWISEFGTNEEDKWPRKTNLLGHEEWSIKFDQILQVARQLGFKVELKKLNEELGIDSEAWYIQDKIDGQTIALSIREALELFPEKYNGKPFIAIRKGYIPTEDDIRLKELERDFGINIIHRDIEAEIEERKKGSKIVITVPPVFKLGDQTDSFYVLKLEK